MPIWAAPTANGPAGVLAGPNHALQDHKLNGDGSSSRLAEGRGGGPKDGWNRFNRGCRAGTSFLLFAAPRQHHRAHLPFR